MKITVCVNTRNRPLPLKQCLKSLLANTFSDFEIIVVDQSAGPSQPNFEDKRLKYFWLAGRGAGKAKNFALSQTKGELMAFTDDDCLVSKNWLATISQIFKKNPGVAGVFGRTKPWKPQSHKNQICPCTFALKKRKVITKPAKHWQAIGFGNNMAFRRTTLTAVNGFRDWLGPGSLGSNADDADLALRLLYAHFKLISELKMVVYHNRWLSKTESKKQQLSYSCGEMACYGYLAFKNKRLGKLVVEENFRDSFKQFKNILKSLLTTGKISWTQLSFFSWQFLFRLRGLFVGGFFSLLT